MNKDYFDYNKKCCPDERWADVRDYEGIYKISSCGRVLSVGRVITWHNQPTKKVYKDKILRLKVTDGYNRIVLHKDNKRKIHMPYRLVAQAFIPNPLNLPEVNHENPPSTNDHAYNLTWMTKIDNMKHAVRTGLQAKGERIWKATLNSNNVKDIKKKLSLPGACLAQIAREYDVTRSAIWSIAHNKTWRHITI